jgi:hypothetical protein
MTSRFQHGSAHLSRLSIIVLISLIVTCNTALVRAESPDEDQIFVLGIRTRIEI